MSTCRGPHGAWWLGALLLSVFGLAGVAAAPQKPAPAKLSAAEQQRRLIPPLDSVSALEKHIAFLKKSKIKARTRYLEAYLYRLRLLSYPYDRPDWSAYRRAVEHR